MLAVALVMFVYYFGKVWYLTFFFLQFLLFFFFFFMEIVLLLQLDLNFLSNEISGQMG